jgi:hypothetical protein
MLQLLANRDLIKNFNQSFTRFIFIDNNANLFRQCFGYQCEKNNQKVGTKEKIEGADYAIEKIQDIGEEIPEIWRNTRRRKLSLCGIIRMVFTFIIVKLQLILGFTRRLFM